MCQKPLLLITIICNLCFFSFNAHAAASRTFTVDSTGDESDSSLSDVDCKTAMGRCTLRAAIEQANSLTSSTKIIFKATVITITMGADLPSIEAEIEIEGHDNLTISGDDKYSLSVLSGGQLTVSTVSFVKSYFHNAGTLAIKECSLYGFFGGTAIMNIGELELNHSKVSHSQGIALNSQNRSTITYSTIDNSNSEYTAVAISCDEPPSDYNSLGMSHSTISDNRGAGISIGENCKADIATSTISHNQGTGGFGGLYNEGTTTLKNVTIANNVACRLYCDSGTIGGGGIIDSSGDGSLALIRTLLVGNQYYDESDNLQNNNCSGVPFEHVSGSISDDASCKLQDIDTFSQDDLDVKLEALADNGGDTKTHMLGKNSPAIDFGNILSYADLTDDHTDQRGLDLGALYDIGSIDVQDKDTDGALENEDCDDDNPAISPLASETCNGIDDDCDGEIDGASAVDVKHWYEDTDGDNYGNPAVSVRQCFAPAGFDPDNTDCDDNNADANPGETEACDGVDNDCNGKADEAGAIGEHVWHKDADQDGYGIPTTMKKSCTQPAGYVADSTDCNDTKETINPGTEEITCNSVDDNCNGAADEGSAADCHATTTDGDGDGYTEVTGDCDDTNKDVSPAAVELCNGKDDDCNGRIDDGLQKKYYRDVDGDGYGNANDNIFACEMPAGYVQNRDDCKDTSLKTNPGANELCDGEDNNCDKTVDEGCPVAPAEDPAVPAPDVPESADAEKTEEIVGDEESPDVVESPTDDDVPEDETDEDTENDENGDDTFEPSDDNKFPNPAVDDADDELDGDSKETEATDDQGGGGCSLRI